MRTRHLSRLSGLWSVCAILGCAYVLVGRDLAVGLRAQVPPRVVYDRLVPGFMAETFGPTGMAQGTGFATDNPWGAYTAYLLATNAKGHRTWRIENYLPNANAGTAQGSTAGGRCR